jgi:hypothetical protein
MKITRWIILLALIAALASWDSHSARAGGSWSAWIYNSDTGKLVHVFPDGAAPVEMDFPLPPDTSTFPYELTISRNGEYLAACLFNDSEQWSVRVYDIYNETYIAAYILPGPIAGCGLSRYSFSEDGSQLAFGILNHFFDDSDPRPAWDVIVMEMHTSAIRHRIDAEAASVMALGHDYDGMLPFISAFQMAQGSFPGVIAFKPVMWGTEGAPEYDSIVWQLSDNSVSIAGPYGKSSLDLLLPNSEAIWVDRDAAFPEGILEGPGTPFNIVKYSNKMGDLYPIYTDGSVLYGSSFIDDGRRVAVHRYVSPVEEWVAFDRSGASLTLPVSGRAWELYGTLDGYVYLDNHEGTGAEVRYGRFSGAALDEFSAWSGLPGEYWRMVWVNPLSGGLGLPPFPPLPVLGEPPLPTLPPPVMITPTPTYSAGGSGLAVGARATVHTTEGDMLRIRSGPGTSYAVLHQFANGTPVTILEGPTSGGGLIWWRVQADDGRGGWAIEGLMEDGAYLQTLVPMG